MTNREYMESLDNEDLAEFIDSEPWGNWCYQEEVDFGGTYVQALAYWLQQEYRENEFEF